MPRRAIQPRALFREISNLIDLTRARVAQTVNTGLVMLYWSIGRRILAGVLRQERATYGEQIVSTLSKQLGWSHILEIIPLKSPLQREFYAEMARVERWSVRTLREKIQSMLFERTAISRKPEKQILKELAVLHSRNEMSPDSSAIAPPAVLPYPLTTAGCAITQISCR